jgi:hypothetical protein
MEERTILQKIGDAVVDFAPGIATVLAATGVGAPVAAAVGAVGALGRAFGLGSQATPEEVLSAISADPEIRLKAQIAENDFLLKKRDQDIEEIKTYLADVVNAREREVKIVQATGKRDVSQELLGWIIVAGFFAVLIIRMSIRIPTDQLENVGMLTGALIVAFTTVVAYKYGSSQGSVNKSATINSMMEKKGG